MSLTEKLKHQIQATGAGFSFWFFSNKNLERDWIKSLYLFLYKTFKTVFEGSEFKKVRKYIKPGSTVLDIGANVGFAACSFAKAAADVRVYSFEPDPVVGKIFEYNLTKSKIKNVKLIKTALGDGLGQVEFAENLGNRADNRVVADGATMSNTRMISVPLTTLSHWIDKNRIADVSFIKIDVQGYEMQVLKGAEQWLRQTTPKPVICIEVWPYGLIQANASAASLYSFMQGLGYMPLDDKPIASGKDQYEDIIFTPEKYERR